MSKKSHKLVKKLLRDMQPGDTAVVATADHASMGKSKVSDENAPDPTGDDDNDRREKKSKRSDESANVNSPLYVRIVRKGSDGGGDDMSVPMTLLFSAVRGNVGMPNLPTAPAPKPTTTTDDHGMEVFDPPGRKRRYHNNCGWTA